MTHSSRDNTPVAVEQSEEAQFAELHRLYNFADDDSRQFTRWQMLVAMRHGFRLAGQDRGEGIVAIPIDPAAAKAIQDAANFLDAAAGEGLELDGLDAADVVTALHDLLDEDARRCFHEDVALWLRDKINPTVPEALSTHPGRPTREEDVERVARAICRHVGNCGDTEAIEQAREDRDWRVFISHALAALQAIHSLGGDA